MKIKKQVFDVIEILFFVLIFGFVSFELCMSYVQWNYNFVLDKLRYCMGVVCFYHVTYAVRVNLHSVIA